jgi:hypothetical protein
MSSPDRRKGTAVLLRCLQAQLNGTPPAAGGGLFPGVYRKAQFFEALRVLAELDEIRRTARETCKCRDPSSEQATEQFELTPEQRIIKHSRGCVSDAWSRTVHI